MKKLGVFALLIVPLASPAQNYPGMSEADMQQMMQQMEKMQSCMEQIDHSRLKTLEQRTQKMEAEVRSLCAGGKRDEAQKKAIAYGKTITSDPVMKSLAKCGKIMQGAMPDLALSDLEKASASHHVCD